MYYNYEAVPNMYGAAPNMQNRLQYLERQQYVPYQNYQQTYPQNFQQQQNFQQRPVMKTFPVASFAEAESAMIEFDGSLNIFVDSQNNCIYTKQLGDDGKLRFEVYKLSKEPPNAKAQYVSQEAFDNLLEQVKVMQEKLESGGKQNERTNASNVQYAKKQ